MTRRTRTAVLALALSVSLPAVAWAQVPAPVEGATQARGVAPRASDRPPHTKGDPLERFNRHMFALNMSIDRAVFRPLAMTLGKIIPRPLRAGIRNVLHNLGEPIVFLNDLLQLRPKHAVRTFGRFALNSTFGIGGLVDVAKTAKLPHENNSFGSTLARYGVGPGPYLFLPFVGPATLRDLATQPLDQAVLPLAIGKPFNRLDYQLGTGAFLGIDKRIESDNDLRTLLSGAADPYATLRSVFLQNRAAEIDQIKGKSAAPAMFDDPLADPAAAAPATPPAEMPAPATTPDGSATSPPAVPPATSDLPADPAPPAAPAPHP